MLAARFLHGVSDATVLKTMSFDMAMTVVSFSGLMLNKFKNPAASYMAVTFGSVAGVVSGVLTGNWLGALNKAGSGAGELALAYGANAEYQEKRNDETPAETRSSWLKSAIDAPFNMASEVLTAPVRALRKAIIRAPAVAQP